MGWQATELERKGIRTDVGDKNRDIKAYNANLVQQKILANEIVIGVSTEFGPYRAVSTFV